MRKRILHECPMCNSTLQVRELYCPRCRIRIQGDFQPPQSRLLSLARKELEFIERNMVSAVTLDVPVEVDIASGCNWLEAKA